MTNKFVIGDHVRVTNPLRDEFDRTGVVTGYAEIQCEPASKVMLTGTDLELIFRHTSLTLADPDVHTVLDEMDAESAVTSMGMDEREIDGEIGAGGAYQPRRFKTVTEEIAAEYMEARAQHDKRVTAEDKLRLIADTVDAQTPSGTELANFRRRLLAILSIGRDA